MFKAGMKTHITRNIIMEEETMMMTMTMTTIIEGEAEEDLLAIYLILTKNLLKFILDLGSKLFLKYNPVSLSIISLFLVFSLQLRMPLYELVPSYCLLIVAAD